jgi:hypothetical protein
VRAGTISILLVLWVGVSSCSIDRLYRMRQRQKIYALEQFDFKDLVNKYMSKDGTSVGTVEGVYSVSSLVVRKGKGFLSSEEKEKVVDRKENYSKVAIIRDKDSANREYLEVSLDKEFLPSFSIVGEFSRTAESNLLVYNHFESRGRTSSYTFSYDKAKDILEGVRTENGGNFTYTYKLTYLKLSPKAK